MLPRLRHIGKILLVALLVMSCSSCTSWREAKAVLKGADSLLARGVIIQDTAVLTEVINTLDNPIGRVIAKDELAKAYYLLGRNLDDYCHDFAAAADYYIEADRLQTTDLVLRGRINSCMGFLCKQDSCFEEALEFYERSSRAFKESGNEWYYAHNLLNVAEQYVNMREYAKADSVLDIAKGYEIDSAYYARMVDVKALAFYNQEMYDSALIYLLSIVDYPRRMSAKCYNQMNIMRSYAHLEKYELAVKYANYILLHTNNPNYRTNAYYCLLKYEEINKNIDKLAKYSYLRKDEDRYSRNKAESYAQASDKLKIYLKDPNPELFQDLCILGGVILIFLLIVVVYILHKRHKSAINSHTNALRMQEERNIARRQLLERKIFDNSIYFTDTALWKSTYDLREKANVYCENVFYRLEDTYHLSEHELKICLMILLEISRDKMAFHLNVMPNTISKAKNKIAKQLGTTSQNLRNFLIEFLAS